RRTSYTQFRSGRGGARARAGGSTSRAMDKGGTDNDYHYSVGTGPTGVRVGRAEPGDEVVES
ncbi:MAG: hypothetical protein OK454_09050, partial [Thaumarchaeota archaeon]|nr:hypothetical protein [Nitrososphaerota archaeon]